MIIAIIIFFFLFLWIFIKVLVFGWYIPKKDLDLFMEKYFTSYHLNEFSNGTMFAGDNDLPYIAKSNTFTILSKWYIKDSGFIPRWSEWSKLLDVKMEQLYKPEPKGIKKYL